MSERWSRAGARWVGPLALALLCPLMLGVERPPGLGDVKDVRTWSYPDYTRVVVELDREVKIGDEGLVRLPPDRRAGRPERLYVDLEGIWVGRRYRDGVSVGDGLLEAVRLGQNTLHASRMVIDLQRYGQHRMFTLSSPDRLVIDVFGPDHRRTRSAPKRKRRESGRPRPSLRLSMEARSLRTAVIDPGHGGRDPGAIGVGGILEKDVNLKLAKLLARRLRARSFRVVLTREDDRYLNLEERTVIAESAGGDVFVSLHTNASRVRTTRGFELYYLDRNHERHSLDVAGRENGIRPAQVDSLQRTLARLRVSEASSYSRRLAQQVHVDVVNGLGQTYSRIPDLGVKKGPFYVLFMSSMPSILIESGFLTNRHDARLLRSERFLDTLAAQIAAGLGHYRNRSQQRTARAGGSGKKLPDVGAQR